MSHTALLVFAKVPEPGRVKTRLVPQLTPQQAAEIHRACLEDTVRAAGAVPGARPWLMVAPSKEPPQRLSAALNLGRGWRVEPQRGRHLGERLQHAFAQRFREGASKVLVVGTDTPWMGRERLARAIAWLDRAPAVLGPCDDGGYYLAGARRLVPQIFRGIPWGTSRVLEATLRALELAGAKYLLLPRDFDLDRPEDLGRAVELLRRQPQRASSLARCLGSLGLEI